MKWVPWMLICFLTVAVVLFSLGVWLEVPVAMHLGFGIGVGICNGFVAALDWARRANKVFRASASEQKSAAND